MALSRFLIKKLQKSLTTSNPKDGIGKNLWQKLLKKVINILEKNQNQKNNFLKEKERKKKEKKSAEERDQELSHSPIEKVNSLDGIYKIIQEYEKFIERDFFAVILNAKATLREWRSEINQILSDQQSIPDSHLEMLSINLSEICQLYQQSSLLLDKFISKCNKYSETIKDINRSSSTQLRFNEATISLDKLKRNLVAQQKIIDYNNDNDFKFLNRHVKEKGSRSL